MGGRQRKGRVLVIDDAESARVVVRGVLQAAGFETEELASPLGATQLIVNKQIDAVVLDVAMPVMSGGRFAELMRKNKLLDDVVLVLVSGESVETLQNLDEQVYADAVMTKGAVVNMLAPLVDRLIRARAEGKTASANVDQEVITGPPARAFALRFERCELALPQGAFRIGRGRGSDLVLDDDTVSRRHAVLHVAEDAVLCEDLGSRNGTRVNGTLIAGSVPVMHAGQITIGQQVFVVEARVGPADGLPRRTSPPPPPAVSEPDDDVDTAVRTVELTLDGLAVRVGSELQKGDIDNAAVVFGNLLLCMTDAARSGAKIADSRVAFATEQAFALAELTKNPEWIEHMLELQGSLGHVISSVELEHLCSVLPKFPTLNRLALRLYARRVRAARPLSGIEGRRLDVIEALGSEPRK